MISQQTIVSTVTSMLNGQPVPVMSIETANLSIGASGFNAIAVNPNASRIYVADGSTLTTIDASSHSVIARTALPEAFNSGIAIDYDRNTIYVSTQEEVVGRVVGEVAEINGSTNMLVGELPFNLASLAFDSATHTLYGATTYPMEAQAGGLIGVDVQTGSIVANISLGFSPHNIAVDPHTGMIAAAGCDQQGLACDAVVSIVNGTSGTLVTTVKLNSAYYTTMAMDPMTNIVYASGTSELVALNGTNGNMVFNSNPQTCGPFLDMAVIPLSDQVLMVPQDYNYLLVYGGVSGTLVNMYSFSSSPQSVAYDPNTNELYVTLSAQLLTFPDSTVIGNVNSTSIGSGQYCLPV